MKRVLLPKAIRARPDALAAPLAAVLLVLLLGALAPASAQGGFPRVYEYRLSWDPGNPYLYARPPFAGVDSVWLWTGTCGTAGYPAGRFVADMSGTLAVLGFIPEPGVLNSGTATDLDLTFSECLPIGEERMLGVFAVSGDGSEQQLCFGGEMVTWDCQATPMSRGSAGVGGRAGDGGVCEVDLCGPVDYVVPESWARVRAKYR